jgi:hypothetical protein
MLLKMLGEHDSHVFVERHPQKQPPQLAHHSPVTARRTRCKAVVVA